MKKIYIALVSVLLFASCELTDVVDQNPPNNLVPENVLQNEGDAKALLNGVYSTLINFSSPMLYMYYETIPGALSGSMSNIGFGSNNDQFELNDLQFDNVYLNNFWTELYSVINGANNTIALVGEMEEGEFQSHSKTELLGEAHFLRAWASFEVLRYYGQFYDLGSEYGIIIRTEPVNFVTREAARSSVAESYEQILKDLDFAIANAPAFSVTYRASRIAAKALKARVLLFMGNYADAAALAEEVIQSQTRTLAGDFNSVFSEGLDSSEMIFMTHRHADSDLEDNNRKRYYSGRTGTTWLPDLMAGDPREEFTYSGSAVLKVNNEESFRPTYYLRLAEMYLIKAEALARLEDFEGSKAALDVIRLRAGLEASTATTLEELKEDIFNEIVRELVFENGSEWFAAIRFDKIMDLKPTVTSEDQYILPIPEDEIFGNAALDLSDQNPGYL